jgi:hypothetical protein
MKRREYFVQLVGIWGIQNKDRIIAEFVQADATGTLGKQSTVSASDCANRLWADGIKKGWIKKADDLHRKTIQPWPV